MDEQGKAAGQAGGGRIRARPEDIDPAAGSRYRGARRGTIKNTRSGDARSGVSF